jgi:hypothetical protein
MNVTRAGDGTITITLPPGEATDLEEELLWVKNVDDGGPVRKLWEALAELTDQGEPAERHPLAPKLEQLLRLRGLAGRAVTPPVGELVADILRIVEEDKHD